MWGATQPPEQPTLNRPYFNPRPPCGGRQAEGYIDARKGKFQSTPPVWGATILLYGSAVPQIHFNPRPPCGGRRSWSGVGCMGMIFQSTPPVWGATETHSVGKAPLAISIHAPRVGGDQPFSIPHRRSRISIHAPRVGGDKAFECVIVCRPKFQSTPPVWGATDTSTWTSVPNWYFNPRPPCGGRRRIASSSGWPMRFQSTPPVWGATRIRADRQNRRLISIHAPRVGGD